MRESGPACHSPPSQLAQLRPQWTWPSSQDPDSLRGTQILGAGDWTVRELVSGTQLLLTEHPRWAGGPTTTSFSLTPACVVLTVPQDRVGSSGMGARAHLGEWRAVHK